MSEYTKSDLDIVFYMLNDGSVYGGVVASLCITEYYDRSPALYPLPYRLEKEG